MLKKLKKEFPYILFILPAFIGYTTFTIIPLIKTFGYAFTNWDGYDRADFVGLKNFVDLFGDAPMTKALTNTLLYALTVPILVTALAVPLAVLLNGKMKTRNLQRAIFFFPSVPSVLILGYLWSYMLSPTSRGLLNTLLEMVGIDKIMWLGEPKLAMACIIGVSVWSQCGWHACIYLANLQSIDSAYIEAARIDGASGWGIFRHITFPMLAPSMTISVMLLLTGSLKVYDLPFSLTEGGPGYATIMLTQIIIRRGISEKLYGKATAMSVVFFIIICVCTVIQLTLMKRREEKLV